VQEPATSRLREEHVHILEVAAALATLVDAADAGRWDVDAFADCVTFIRLFADACHHGKEEDLLFPALEEVGLPHDQGPIAVILAEHQPGRVYARHMAGALDGGDPQARATLRNAATGYVNLIRGHIAKEDNVLFAMADQAVRGPTCRSLCAAYGAVCARRFEGHTKEQLQQLGVRIRGPRRLAATRVAFNRDGAASRRRSCVESSLPRAATPSSSPGATSPASTISIPPSKPTSGGSRPGPATAWPATSGPTASTSA
jgi:hemerythrin-like domain-containing protein